MKNISRLFLFGALTLVLLTTACAGQQASPTPTATAPATATSAATDTPTAAANPTDTPTATVTPAIPVTGANAVLVQCQFCIDNLAHALLLIPAGATFTILTPTATVSPTTNTNIDCSSVETFNDRQVVLCHGEQNTPVLLNICEGTNCRQFTVQLQPCPPAVLTTATITPTPKQTLTPSTTPATTPTFTPTPAKSPTSPAATATAHGPTSTSTLTLTSTFTPTPTP